MPSNNLKERELTRRLCSAVLYCTTLYCTSPYSTAMHSAMMCCRIMHCTVLDHSAHCDALSYYYNCTVPHLMQRIVARLQRQEGYANSDSAWEREREGERETGRVKQF
jgi:hypothetical protein